MRTLPIHTLAWSGLGHLVRCSGHPAFTRADCSPLCLAPSGLRAWFLTALSLHFPSERSCPAGEAEGCVFSLQAPGWAAGELLPSEIWAASGTPLELSAKNRCHHPSAAPPGTGAPLRAEVSSFPWLCSTRIQWFTVMGSEWGWGMQQEGPGKPGSCLALRAACVCALLTGSVQSFLAFLLVLEVLHSNRPTVLVSSSHDPSVGTRSPGLG